MAHGDRGNWDIQAGSTVIIVVLGESFPPLVLATNRFNEQILRGNGLRVVLHLDSKHPITGLPVTCMTSSISRPSLAVTLTQWISAPFRKRKHVSDSLRKRRHDVTTATQPYVRECQDRRIRRFLLMSSPPFPGETSGLPSHATVLCPSSSTTIH